MKNIILIPTILILIITSVVAQDYPKARYLNIQNDKNIRPDSDKKLCVSCSDNNFIIDGDESHGYIELNFSGIDLYGQAKIIKLIMNTADVKWAESGDGFGVYFNDEKIGNIANVSRNSCFVINLNSSKIADKKNIKLEVDILIR